MWVSSLFYSCIGMQREEEEEHQMYDFKKRFLEISLKPNEDIVLCEMKKLMRCSPFHSEFENIMREFKNLGISNIWLYTVPRVGAQVSLLPNSKFGKRNAIKIFFGTKMEFYTIACLQGKYENLVMLRDAGFLQE